MSLISWEKIYKVNIAELDDQHKKIVELLNTLSTLSTQNNNSTMRNVLSDLIDYTIYHFDTEEKYMLDHKYPFTENHSKEHADLRAEVQDIKKRYEHTKDIHVTEVYKFLKGWLVKHIMLSDKKYSIYFNKQK